MTEPAAFCMSITPFTETGDIDEAAFRIHMRRMVAAGVGVYLGSPGSGEGHSLTDDELRRVYEIGVEEAKGKVPVHANPPEGRTADEVIRRMRLAEAAGVDVVQIYTMDGGHGMRPTVHEQYAYYRAILDEAGGQMALSVNLLAGGYVNPIEVFATLVREYEQISLINVNHGPTSFLAELIDTLGGRVRYCTSAQMLPEGLALGATGCLTGELNVIPHTIRVIGRSLLAGDLGRYRQAMHGLFALERAVRGFRWPSGAQTNARWIKAAMAGLDLPGHSKGYLRPPYLPSTADEIAQLAVSLKAAGVAALEATAQTWNTE